MVFGLFNKQPLVDPSSSEWIFQGFGWALQNFDAELFYSDTVLVRPTNEYFPGKVNSVHGMAEIIFDRVKVYAGISHWPTLVQDQSVCQLIESQQVQIQGALRRPDGIADESIEDNQRLVIPYNPQQINNPEGMIATYAHILSHHMGRMAKVPPPGGSDYWPHLKSHLRGTYRKSVKEIANKMQQVDQLKQIQNGQRNK